MGQNRDAHTIGIYVHIPFCEKKCFYCDFYSLENHSLRNEFISSLVREISGITARTSERPKADTIFFGGGTPSLLSEKEFDLILDTIRSNFNVSEDAEVTAECNPGTIDLQKLRAYSDLGINRLSFGVQSFFDDELKFLSRIHDSKQAAAAIETAHAAGFENVNLDLMYALPGQTIPRLESNLNRAIELGTKHISAYALIVEPGTPLFSAVAEGKVDPAGDSEEAAMYQHVMEALENSGFNHYEISNYSRDGFKCRHNLKYWNCEEYVGFGPSAHSYMAGRRWWNVSSLTNYVDSISAGKSPISAAETLNDSQKLDEFVLLKLRQGRLNLIEAAEKFGLSIGAQFVADLVKAGYASLSVDTLALTSKGFTVCDEIAEDLLAKHSVSV